MADSDAREPIDTALLMQPPAQFVRHPAANYLASLPSEASRRVMSRHLRTIAALLVGVDPGHARRVDIFLLNWAGLRRAHTAAIRARLIERYRPATVNRMLGALRGVLAEARRLGEMSDADFAGAGAVENVRRGGL